MSLITPKPWGCEVLLEHNEKYVVKKLLMKAGCRCSLQKHLKKCETILVLENTLQITIGDDILYLDPGEHLTIQPNVIHRMAALNEDCLYMEASTPELDDVVRIEDDYQR
jgi:mannose-6-phosphate isomerase